MQTAELSPEALVESSISFEYLEGGITPVAAPHTTGWRVLPFGVITQCLNGIALVETAQGFQRCYGDGECLFMPPGIPHRISIEPPIEVISRWSHVRFMALDAIDLLSWLFSPHVFDRAQGYVIGDIVEQLAQLCKADTREHLSTIVRRQALGFQLLTHLLESLPSELADVTLFQGMQRVLPVLRFVQDHFAEGITRPAMASLVNLSPTRFHVVFKELTGLPPLEYVKHVRIKHAQRLLIETEQSIAEVATASGFPDAFHFSRIFKAACGHSPSHYRRTVRDGLLSARWT